MKVVVLILLLSLGMAQQYSQNQNCNITDSSNVNLLFSGLYEGTGYFCSYSAAVNGQFYWYFENPFQSQLPNDPVILVWINNIGESVLSPIFLEVGPVQLVDGVIKDRDNSFLNYMGLIFIEAPAVGFSTGNPEGNLLYLSKQFKGTLDNIIQRYNLTSPNIKFSLYGRQYGAMLALFMKQQYYFTSNQYTLILDNPVLDMVTQKTAIGPGGLGIGLYSPEQTNIVQTKIANCITSGLSGASDQGTQCASLGAYFEFETQLDSYDTRQQLLGPQNQPSFVQQQAQLQKFIQQNSPKIGKFYYPPLIKQLSTFQIFNQKVFDFYQPQFQRAAGNMIQMARTLLSKEQFGIIASEFNMQEPALGATKLVAEILAVPDYRRFPEKHIYRAGSLARQVNGLTAGFFYQKSNLSFVILSRGLHINQELELNATTELVLNLALNNSKLCYQGTCKNTYGKCEAMKNCSGNGVCTKEGFCNCNQGFALEDCSLPVHPILNVTSQLNLQPRQWYLINVTVSNPNYEYLQLSTDANDGYLEAYVSLKQPAIDTFENFAGNRYNISYGIARGGRNITFLRPGVNIVSIRNPSFTQNVSFSQNFTQPFIIPSVSYDPNPLSIPSYIMFGVGGLAVLIGIYIYFAKVK